MIETKQKKEAEEFPYTHAIRLEVQSQILNAVRGIPLELNKSEDFGLGETCFKNKLTILLERK